MHPRVATARSTPDASHHEDARRVLPRRRVVRAGPTLGPLGVAPDTANDNAAFGIEAIAGVTDGGGNRATGNGAATQCSGVHCR
jgi:hypothetical protein